MTITFDDDSHGATKSVVLKGWMRLGLSLWLLGLPVVLGYYGYQFAESRSPQLQRDEAAQARVDGLREQRSGLERARQHTNSQEPAFSSRLSRLQTRLETLREVLAGVTGHDSRDTGHTYAQALQARPGDVVRKGQVIALAGFSVPQTPFAVHKNGRVIDPASYLHSTFR